MKCPQCHTVNPDFAESCSYCGNPIPVSDSETIQKLDATVLSPGSDFGPRYRIEALLGEGGMGRVYKAYDKDLDRTVAIKVVREGIMGDAEVLRRFKQELLLASKISHKNILRIHDMGEVGDVRLISMAYVEGKDLQGIQQENPKLPLERVLKFATQLAEALAAAHSEGVVHRDLKPQNILVNKDDQIFVSDFGLAKSFEEGAIGMTRTGAFIGTPRYMSPEQVDGKPADLRSDLYSYGLIIYELVTGESPFTGDSVLKVMYQRVREKPKDPKQVNPEVPSWLARIIMRCLEVDPAQRYQSAYEILADLKGSKSTSGSRVMQIELPGFTEWRWVWGAAGLLVLLSLALAIPPVRHFIFAGRAKSGSAISGVPPLSEGKFVAILPFKVLGDDQSLGYVAEGMNEALTTKLFQLKDLRLASETAVAKVSEKDPLEKTARSLGVNLIVQGTIQGNATKMAVILNLQDVADGRKLWSNTFTGTTQDLLSLEDKVNTELVSALSEKASNEELAHGASHPTENIEAYDLYLKGRKAMRGQQDLNNVQTAIAYYEDALKKDPGFALAYAGVADASLVMYREKKDGFWSEKAVMAAQRAAGLNDNLAEVHFALGSVYNATGKTTESIAELKRALELAPNSDEGYVHLGATYLAGGQSTEAIHAYQKAIEINPYYWVNYNSIGNAYFQLGDYDKAMDAYRRMTELEPDNAFGYISMGNVYLQQGKYEEAIPPYQKALALQPHSATYTNLGTAYFFLKRYSDAVPMYEKAVEMSPNDEILEGNLADAYRWSGQRDKANAAYDQAIALAYKDLEVNPRSAETLGDLALYYAKKGDSPHAVAFIRRARAIEPNRVALLYDAAVVQVLAGDIDEAMKSLRQAFQKGYPTQNAQDDPELKELSSRPEFERLVSEFGRKPH